MNTMIKFCLPATILILSTFAQEKKLYDIGNPSINEQFLLELINRARIDPAGEPTRLQNISETYTRAAYVKYKVDWSVLKDEFSRISPCPPLAFSKKLNITSNIHTENMCLFNCYDGHLNMGDYWYSIWEEQTGYKVKAGLAAQCTGSSISSAEMAHAGFQVDWGVTDLGHRNVLHMKEFRELGISYYVGCIKCGTNPLSDIVTVDIATSVDLDVPLITGVVYVNSAVEGTKYYDRGEGKSGIRIDVDKSEWYAITASAGGYTIPVLGNGTYKVNFTGENVNAQYIIEIKNNENIKLDHIINNLAKIR